MAKRREVLFETPDYESGFSRSARVQMAVTRWGVEVTAYYDSMVGIEGFSLTWDELERARAEVNRVEPKGVARHDLATPHR